MTGISVSAGFFDGASVEANLDCATIDQLQPDERAALDAFLALTAVDRKQATRHVAAFAREQWAAQGSLRAALPLNVWKHVTPGPIFFMHGHGSDEAVYVAMEAECAWEAEHGLLMVWRHGRELCKVGPFDGHPTNVNAYADPELEGVVYQGMNKRFTTKE